MPVPSERNERKGMWSKRRRVWITVGVLACVLLMLFAFAPAYHPSIATVDEQHRWDDSPPPRREIVWQPATRMEFDQAPEAAIRPQLADNGTTLYYSIRDSQLGLQIVQSRRTDEGWTQPRSVDELNSAADDIGPVIRADGQVLFLYSDRVGGFGGMDLYASELQEGKWTAPINLGSQINSAAHEYDPAIAPDGSRLYFASNRAESVGSTSPAWGTTLRGLSGSAIFDLYSSDFQRTSAQWQSANKLTALNTEFNEGAPAVSPDGAFLLFASDRPTPRREARNYDLYRIRINSIAHGQTELVNPENLGAGVNTSANELEPALAMSGFQLLFSRSDAESPKNYALYQSTSQEVYHDGQWRQSRLKGITAWLVNLLTKFWWLLVLLSALAVLLWIIREMVRRRIAIPAFLLAALILHFLLATGSFFVFFQQSIADKFKQLFDEQVVAVEILTETASASSTEQPSFVQVAKLDLTQPFAAPDFAKQPSDVPTPMQAIELLQPQPLNQQPLRPAEFAEEMDAVQVVASVLVPDRTAAPESNDPLQRARVFPQPTSDNITMETTTAVPSQPITVNRVAVTKIAPPKAELPDAVVSVPDPMTPANQPRTTALTESSVAVDREELSVKSPEIELLEMQRQTKAIHDSDNDVDSPSPSEQVAAKETSSLQTPSTSGIQLDRVAPMQAATLPQPEPMKLARAVDGRSPRPEANAIPIVAKTEAGATKISGAATSPLRRRSALASATADSDSAVRIESIGAKASPQEPLRPPTTMAVELKRQNETAATPLGITPASMLSPLASSRPLSSPTSPADSPLARTTITTNATNRSTNPIGLQRKHEFDHRYADAEVNLQSLLRRRNLDEATKAQVVEQFGGSDQTLAAIRGSLTWIAQHQHEDGHWGLNDFNTQCKDHRKCDGHGSSKSDTGGTGLALLPFLGDGNTHEQGPYKELVRKGIGWLIQHQKPDGDLFSGGEGNSRMYSHGIATIVLCECYGMSGDVSLRAPAQKAIDFIVAAQDPRSGGWRYQPREAGDTSVVGWQVMALKSGQMAELNVPRKTLTESKRWLESVAGKNGQAGQYAYQGGRYNPAMTAESLLCLQYLDHSRDSNEIVSSADYLKNNLPEQGRETSYYWYYATQAMFHLQGDHWKQWNAAIHPLLVESQLTDGPMAGTWDPKDQWEKSGGRIYSTSLRTLMLEVYYRHLPIYQVIE